MQSYTFLENLLFPPTYLNKKLLKKSLEGKTVVISGASYGIGESLALLLAETGARLILIARTEEKLLKVKANIAKKGGLAEIFAADLTNEADLKGLTDYLLGLPDGVDIFVNNAGKSIRRSIFDSLDRFHDFERTMALNYFAPVNLLLSLMPLLIEKKGQIINISALNVLMAPAPKWAAYQASKTAFDQWIRSVAAELDVKNVKTSNVYLPLVRTRMIAPTKSYDKMPAMQPNHVAKIIAKIMYSKRRRFQPWWAFFGILGSVLFRGIWERYAKYLKI
jgi:short-subunit dehydrogenase